METVGIEMGEGSAQHLGGTDPPGFEVIVVRADEGEELGEADPVGSAEFVQMRFQVRGCQAGGIEFGDQAGGGLDQTREQLVALGMEIGGGRGELTERVFDEEATGGDGER